MEGEARKQRLPGQSTGKAIMVVPEPQPWRSDRQIDAHRREKSS
ncbi:hypothetical protein [Sphingobium indicum]|nr:hypothetical protein [Sphingobium indicum]